MNLIGHYITVMVVGLFAGFVACSLGYKVNEPMFWAICLPLDLIGVLGSAARFGLDNCLELR